MTETARRPRVCLSMITKNERDNIPRLLQSLVGQVDAWVIRDTGSTDGTQDIVRSMIEPLGQPLLITQGEFRDFSQARNDALQDALDSGFEFDYILLADSDMQLLVDRPDWRDGLTSDAYMMLQFTGALVYWNTRIVKRSASPRYIGVTHEYLDLKGRTDKLEGARFLDHASGSNRSNKLPRDEKLLLDGLAAEPDNGRYMFYLARTLKEMGRLDEAVEWFNRRITQGGWPEEAWCAMLEAARCLRQAGRNDEFVSMALRAYGYRPSRAEPLLDLARFYNEQRNHAPAALFAKRAFTTPLSKDLLFVESDAYNYAPRQEFSIAANYLRGMPEFTEGYDEVEVLSHDPAAPGYVRGLARHNTIFYAEMLSNIATSFAESPIKGFNPPAGRWTPTNPSVFRRGEEIWAFQRTVDYRIRPDGSYELSPDPGGVVGTRTFLVRFDDDLNVLSQTEIREPVDMPEPVGTRQFSGLEDLRGWDVGGQIYCTAVVCELEPDKRRQLLHAKVAEDGQLTEWRVLNPQGAAQNPRSEKNWMPLADGMLPNLFLYSTDPIRVLDDTGRDVVPLPARGMPAIGSSDHYRGGSQLIPFHNGYIGLIHEVAVYNNRRQYLHRFVFYEHRGLREGPLTRGGFGLIASRRSRPFFLTRKSGIEFAAGLCWHPDGQHLVLSYGVEDCESHIGTVLASEIGTALGLAPADYNSAIHGDSREAA